MTKRSFEYRPIAEALKLEQEVQRAAAAIALAIVVDESPDPELFVTLRGSSERLIELDEECKDN